MMDTDSSDEHEGANASDERPARARHVVAVGGGKGGVGKSLLVANLGVYLAQLGRRVVLVDVDFGCANLHTFVGVDRPRRTLSDFFQGRVERLEDCVVETQVAGLGLVSAAGMPPWATHPRAALKQRLAREARELAVDYLLFDLPGGTGETGLDFFGQAQVGVVVTCPEPAAIESAWRFIKGAFLRRLRGVPGLEPVLAQVNAETDDYLDEGGVPAPLDLYQAALAADARLAHRIIEEIHRFRPRLVVNHTRARADLDLGPQLRAAGHRRLGLALDHLGHLETDDAAWLALRKRRPLLVEHPDSKIARNLDRVARRLLAIEPERSPERLGASATPEPPRVEDELSFYEAMEVDPGASDEELRRAYKRAREVYSDDSMVTRGLYSPERLASVHERIEMAYDVLLDPARRKRYDLDLFPEGIPPQPMPSREPSREWTAREGSIAPAGESGAVSTAGSAPTSVGALGGGEPGSAPEVTPETEFTGALLRTLREARGIDLRDVAQRTKINISHLRAIEAERWDELPAPVYLRGFLVEFARQLRLDPAQVARTMLARLGASQPS